MRWIEIKYLCYYIRNLLTDNIKCLFPVKDAYDYQGRSFLHAPQDVGVNLRSEEPPEKCFLPKKLIHTWSGHSKGVAAIRWYPHTAHLMLSAGMDTKIKVSMKSGQDMNI